MVRTTGKTDDFTPVRQYGNGWIVNFARETVLEQVYEETTNSDGETVRTPTGETKETELSTWTEEFFGTKPSLYELSASLSLGGTPQDFVSIATDFGYTESEMLPRAKQLLAERITEYDTSDNVNSFTLGGKQMWLDKVTRVGLVNSVTMEKNAGKAETTLWFGGERYTLPVDTALQMLSALELYALECYNVTQRHLAEVEALETAEAAAAYDWTEGYPEKLELSV